MPPRSAFQGASEMAPASRISPPESSLGTAQDDIRLNWILFDKSHRTPDAVISIPRNLYEQQSQFCQTLFVQQLSERYDVGTTPARIEFWTVDGTSFSRYVVSELLQQPNALLSVKVAIKKGWATSIVNFDADFTPVPLPLPFSSEITVDDAKLIHLVVTVRDQGLAGGQTDVDEVPELPEFQRYQRMVQTPGRIPSTRAKSTEYREVQSNDAQAIYDGRWAPNGLVSTIGPPIQIFHPIFDEFTHLVNNPAIQPTPLDLKNVQKLMRSLSEVGLKEYQYTANLRKYMKPLLPAEIIVMSNDDRTKSDGVVAVLIGDIRVASLIIELKRELGEGSCDPTTQAGLSMKRSWIQTSREAIREKCCCPTFLLAGGGPWLSVLGGVFTDKFIVQRLTDMRWMGLSSTEEDSRVYHNARVFIALHKCLVKLHNFYLSLDNVPPCVAKKPHPRYFPYPTSFTAQDGSLTRFRYLASLEDDSACVTYLAEIPKETDAPGDSVKLVVKFVARYGAEVHEFLARKGYAPALRYWGPLPETPLSGIFPGPAQNAEPGLCLRSEFMHMVVMDYINAQPNPPPDVHDQIKAILTLLHLEGYVFGDLRAQNILFDAYGKVKLIDFNWCGRYNMSIRDEELPNDLQKQIDEIIHDGNGPYVCYPLSMSTRADMWASGMEPLGPIRPQHDWKMLKKLQW